MKATWLPKYNDNTNRLSTKQIFPKRCPTGTIVIRRTTKEDLIRARKYTHQIQSRVQPLQEQMADTSGGAFHYARVSIDAGKGPKYYGASTDLDVFQLSGVSENQASTSQIILSKGERGPRNYINSVQAGWHVNYQWEGDNSTHFFTYWTSDGSQKTGCYNLVCKRFVQISTRLAPGMIYTQSSLSLSIYRDRFTLNWMLYNDREPVGYWPKEIFDNMADCSQVQMGGDVYSPLGEPSPPMGSGVLNEAKFTRVLLTDGRGNDIKVTEYTTINDLPNYIYGVTSDLQTLTYGGPGGWRKA
ncbi:protein neprosin-like isoform X1 [Musa acuminata AAA Group]|uniref:protein neprosin-like isoform X1 n=2 Tax=Musa acuminata AAA Group TaxID=214697 RepID=UPI0031DFF09A